jgi:hypothetical protein
MKAILILGISLLTSLVFAQNVGINSTGAAPVNSAALDIDMANKGLLIPRVALTTANAFAPLSGTATTSLLIYNTATAGTAPNAVAPGYYYWNGTRWMRVVNDSDVWNAVGNTGTNAATNFIGTTDAVDFVTRVNNTEYMRLTTAGNLGLGTASPSQRLTVTGGNMLITDAAGTG